MSAGGQSGSRHSSRGYNWRKVAMEADINVAIAKLVEGRRIHLGMSRADLARASGVSYSTLDSLERRHRGCSAADLWRIAQVLGVSMADLCSSAAEASS